MDILWLIIGGVVIGLLGKFVAPGDKDNIPLWLTVLCGIGGMLLGDYIYAAFGGDGSGGVDWVRWHRRHHHRGRARRDRLDRHRSQPRLAHARLTLAASSTSKGPHRLVRGPSSRVGIRLEASGVEPELGHPLARAAR